MADEEHNIQRFWQAYLGRNFSHNLVWPAAAGNVFWSLLSLLIDSKARAAVPGEAYARVSLLLLLSAYLTFDWQREQQASGQPLGRVLQKRVCYWLLEELHLLAIVIVAIMATTGAPVTWILVGLLGLFSVTTIGHVFGAWDRHTVATLLKALANLIGVVLIVIGLSSSTASTWWPFIAMMIVLALWIAIVVGADVKKYRWISFDVGASVRS